mmetsp:Transcript_27154/g.86270  ORF Transcript_27154/g.86270 Transcript_27154/m.86270 type:complete len:396 (-) Transcript_27154:547-1734(-)
MISMAAVPTPYFMPCATVRWTQPLPKSAQKRSMSPSTAARTQAPPSSGLAPRRPAAAAACRALGSQGPLSGPSSATASTGAAGPWPRASALRGPAPQQHEFPIFFSTEDRCFALFFLPCGSGALASAALASSEGFAPRHASSSFANVARSAWTSPSSAYSAWSFAACSRQRSCWFSSRAVRSSVTAFTVASACLDSAKAFRSISCTCVAPRSCSLRKEAWTASSSSRMACTSWAFLAQASSCSWRRAWRLWAARASASWPSRPRLSSAWTSAALLAPASCCSRSCARRLQASWASASCASLARPRSACASLAARALASACSRSCASVRRTSSARAVCALFAATEASSSLSCSAVSSFSLWISARMTSSSSSCTCTEPCSSLKAIWRASISIFRAV